MAAKVRSARYAVCVGPGKIEFRERDLPPLGARQVLIETRAVGLCTSDLLVITGEHEGITSPPFPTDYIGHEPGGVVVETGPEVTRFRPGDRVSSIGGAHGPDIRMQFADRYVQDESMVFPLPDNLSFAEGLCEPLGAVVKATLSSGIGPADTVAIVGAGFFGQLLAQSIRLQGAWRVAVFDLRPERLEIAKRLGADRVYNVLEQGVDRALQEMTDGGGFDLVLECAGMAGAFDTATELVRRRGTIYSYGVHALPETIDLLPWHLKGPRILNNWSDPVPDEKERQRRYAEIGLDWAGRGWLQLGDLIDTRPLDRFQEAIDEVLAQPTGVVKLVLVA
jgi:L-iditol 2-dehydrogenase